MRLLLTRGPPGHAFSLFFFLPLNPAGTGSCWRRAPWTARSRSGASPRASASSSSSRYAGLHARLARLERRPLRLLMSSTADLRPNSGAPLWLPGPLGTGAPRRGHVAGLLHGRQPAPEWKHGRDRKGAIPQCPLSLCLFCLLLVLPFEWLPFFPFFSFLSLSLPPSFSFWVSSRYTHPSLNAPFRLFPLAVSR